jgi:hypothetical protein
VVIEHSLLQVNHPQRSRQEENTQEPGKGCGMWATMDDLPAKEGYRSHRMLDFARMGRSQGTGIIHRYGPPCRWSTSQSTP